MPSRTRSRRAPTCAPWSTTWRPRSNRGMPRLRLSGPREWRVWGAMSGPLINKMDRIVGIDLGTTNSLVAYVDERTGLPVVIADADGRRLLPSIVGFTPDGIVVGE